MNLLTSISKSLEGTAGWYVIEPANALSISSMPVAEIWEGREIEQQVHKAVKHIVVKMTLDSTIITKL